MGLLSMASLKRNVVWHVMNETSCRFVSYVSCQLTVVDQCKTLWLKMSSARGGTFVHLLGRESHAELAVRHTCPLDAVMLQIFFIYMCFGMVCFSWCVHWIQLLLQSFGNDKVIKCHQCQGLGLQNCCPLMLSRLIPPSEFWSPSESHCLGI